MRLFNSLKCMSTYVGILLNYFYIYEREFQSQLSIGFAYGALLEYATSTVFVEMLLAKETIVNNKNE
jgi:hypothetical protein